MGYQVSGRIELSIFINNVEFPLDNQNMLHFMHIGTSTRQTLPTCHFAITDVLHTLDQIELQDGIPIRITIKAWQATTQTFNFRKFHHKKTFNGGSFMYEVDGYWDASRYWTGTSLAGITGTSYNVLSSIASTCGLPFVGDNTNDSQLWLPRNRTYGEFARKVASRGYSNNSSYMVLGVDLTGTMRYKNMSTLPASQYTVVLGQMVQGSITCTDYKPLAKSGLNNKMTGYQHTRYNQSMTGDTTQANVDSVTLTPDVTSPLFNPTVKTQMVTGYKTWGGIDVGNTNTNYDQAIYQNMRFANTYSLDVEFLIMLPTPMNLFDKFTFAVDTDQQKQDAAYAGDYIVAAKAWFVTGATFAEKIVGVRQGVNMPFVQG